MQAAYWTGNSAQRVRIPPVPRQRSTSLRLPGWLRHRQVLTTEAVLLVALGMELAQRWVTAHQDVPWWVKTIAMMVVSAGLLGGLLLILTTWAKGSLSSATRAVQSVPLPAPLLLAHIVAVSGIFVLYAWVWDFWPAAWTGRAAAT